MITPTISISYIVELFFNIIFLILIFVIFLSWIPIFDTRKEPVASFVRIYNFIMAPFRVIPPIGMIDISPIFAFLLLALVRNAILIILSRFGL